jgi:hypothetical protein
MDGENFKYILFEAQLFEAQVIPSVTRVLLTNKLM